MSTANLRKKILSDIEDLPEKKVKEVIDFISYLKFREDEWFIRFVNKRGARAKAEREAGRKFPKLKDLQKEYR